MTEKSNGDEAIVNRKEEFVDEKLFTRATKQAKRIQYNKEWQARPVAERLEYLHKLSDSLNEACQIIQNERNDLCVLLNRMQADLKQTKLGVQRDRQMMHKVLIKENEEKQKLLKESAELHSEIRALNVIVKKGKEKWQSPSTGAPAK